MKVLKHNMKLKRTWKLINKEANRKIAYFLSCLKLKRLNDLNIPKQPDEIRLFLIVRNESSKLPYLFSYYKKMGVDRFFIIDNNSTDDTVDFLLSQKNTHVFQTKEKFQKKIHWKLFLLNNYGINHWCVTADSDEILIYPHYQDIDLRKLSEFLEREGASAIKSIWIDMYSDKPIKESHYKKGLPFLTALQFFDRDCRTQGPPTRVFGWRRELDKTNFLKYDQDIIVDSGHHRVGGRVSLSAVYGATLHFKFTSDFLERTFEEVKREQAHLKAAKFKKFKSILVKDPDVSLYYNGSVKFKDDKQLTELGIMRSSDLYEEYARECKKK